MKIIKRSGEEQDFNIEKVKSAILKANKSIPAGKRISKDNIEILINSIKSYCEKCNRVLNVEEIQDIVERKISEFSFDVGKAYITYRYKRDLARKSNTTDRQVLSLIECCNQDVKEENSNKNPTICSVQRDYMAGEVSKDLSRRVLLPEDVVKAHDEGIIHFHDMDYYAQHIHNCDLVNLEDMLQNGTVISGTKIDKPHSFYTACNIATQIIAQVASSQYGGQSISLSHLAPFVDISRHNYRCDLYDRCKKNGVTLTEEQFDAFVDDLVRREIRNGIQTLQYQVVTLMTTNG